ncbi:hypothetical protein B0H14DRAFT_3752116 [Mycena olivaceomarginata]|nr:hypothetical protein B0H14DRAFT_3752116 [Mycena olivaceomarginata]
MASTSTQLPDARLVVTGHTPDGTSVFTFDDIRPPFTPFGSQGAHFTSFHGSPTYRALPRARDRPPALPARGRHILHHRHPAKRQRADAPNPEDEKTVKARQRGANHAWHNHTEAPCRIALVMVGTQKIVLGDGRVLEQTVFGKKPE